MEVEGLNEGSSGNLTLDRHRPRIHELTHENSGLGRSEQLQRSQNLIRAEGQMGHLYRVSDLNLEIGKLAERSGHDRHRSGR